jgi:hypothetical protein
MNAAPVFLGSNGTRARGPGFIDPYKRMGACTPNSHFSRNYFRVEHGCMSIAFKTIRTAGYLRESNGHFPTIEHPFYAAAPAGLPL